MAKKNMRPNSQGLSTTFLISRIVIRLACYALLVVVAIAAARRAYVFGYSVFDSKPMTGSPGKDVAVTIDEGMSAEEIGTLLKDKQLIRDVNVFRVQYRIYNYKIYPGTYVLNTSQDVSEMIAVMSTVPETEEDGTVIPTKASSEGS